MPTARIISIGDELLNGTVQDTNSPFIAGELQALGLPVSSITTIGDSTDLIKETFSRASEDIVISTGGLGPTDDDCTVEACSRLLSCEITQDRPSAARLESWFHSSGREVRARDYRMCEYPAASTVLGNPQGLAPGFYFNHTGTLYIILPGVPGECRAIFTEMVKPLLRERWPKSEEESVTYYIAGLRESQINDLLTEDPFLAQVPAGITVQKNSVAVTFTTQKKHVEPLPRWDSMEKIFSTHLLLEGHSSIEMEVVALCRDKGYQITAAESCTGGLVAAAITSVPGSSAVFMGSLVTYSNEEKTLRLKVDENILLRHGAVSEETAGAMARGAAEVYNASIACAVSGIAGPGGGTEEKPVGTVCFGWQYNGEVFTDTHFFKGHREAIRRRSVTFSLERIRTLLRNETQ